MPLPRSTTPAEPTIPRLFDGVVDAALALPTARASAVDEFRGSITRLWHLLPTLHEWCCHHPCKARFRLAGSPLPGGSSTLWTTTKGFSSSHPPLLDLAWRKGSFIRAPSHSGAAGTRYQRVARTARALRARATRWPLAPARRPAARPEGRRTYRRDLRARRGTGLRNVGAKSVREDASRLNWCRPCRNPLSTNFLRYSGD